MARASLTESRQAEGMACTGTANGCEDCLTDDPLLPPAIRAVASPACRIRRAGLAEAMKANFNIPPFSTRIQARLRPSAQHCGFPCGRRPVCVSASKYFANHLVQCWISPCHLQRRLSRRTASSRRSLLQNLPKHAYMPIFPHNQRAHAAA